MTMNEIFFLITFFSYVWILTVIMYWFTTPSTGIKNDRKNAKLNYSKYCNKKGLIAWLIRYLYLFSIAYVVYPIRGTLVALLIILFNDFF